jgi:hypothetical protein
MERIFVDQARLSVSNVSGETSSQLSDFVEWVFPCLVNWLGPSLILQFQMPCL